MYRIEWTEWHIRLIGHFRLACLSCHDTFTIADKGWCRINRFVWKNVMSWTRASRPSRWNFWWTLVPRCNALFDSSWLASHSQKPYSNSDQLFLQRNEKSCRVLQPRAICCEWYDFRIATRQFIVIISPIVEMIYGMQRRCIFVNSLSFIIFLIYIVNHRTFY